MEVSKAHQLYALIDEHIRTRLKENSSVYRELWYRGGTAVEKSFPHFRVESLQWIDDLQTRPEEACKSIIERMPNKPLIITTPSWVVSVPYYDLNQDYIFLPDWYVDWKAEIGIAFEMLVLSAEHAKRLNRPVVDENSYSKEALYACQLMTAAIGSLYLQAYGGIVSEYFDNSIAFLQYKLEKTGDAVLLEIALMKAKEAAVYILKDNPIVSSLHI